jgi:hypothetical protein
MMEIHNAKILELLEAAKRANYYAAEQDHHQERLCNAIRAINPAHYRVMIRVPEEKTYEEAVADTMDVDEGKEKA